MKLYYNELANPNAKVSYKLDGVTIEPKDNTLEFPEFEGFYKRFRLEVYIDEEKVVNGRFCILIWA